MKPDDTNAQGKTGANENAQPTRETGQKHPSSDATPAADKNPGPRARRCDAPEVVTDIRERLLAGESSHEVAADYDRAPNTIQNVATDPARAADIGPLKALGTTGHWVKRELATDGGLDDHEDNGGAER